MTERVVLLQRVIQQRGERPKALRIWSDGTVQHGADSNPPPGPDDRLDKDHHLAWIDDRRLNSDQIEALKHAIEQSNFFDLEPVLLINYCKEDPGTAIWTVNLEDSSWRVVVFDPRPRRSPALDILNSFLKGLLETSAV